MFPYRNPGNDTLTTNVQPHGMGAPTNAFKAILYASWRAIQHRQMPHYRLGNPDLAIDDGRPGSSGDRGRRVHVGAVPVFLASPYQVPVASGILKRSSAPI